MLEDQRRYADRVAELTGLDEGVVRAWVEASAGPGVRRIGHGYLTPDRDFPSLELAAAHAAQRIHASGILPRLTVAGPLAQLHAVSDHEGHFDTLLAHWMKGPLA